MGLFLADALSSTKCGCSVVVKEGVVLGLDGGHAHFGKGQGNSKFEIRRLIFVASLLKIGLKITLKGTCFLLLKFRTI